MKRRETIESIIAEMTRRWRKLDAAGDFRAVFAASYLATTERVLHATTTSHGFRDPAWIVQIDCNFAERYFDAFDAFERADACPRPWEIAFRHATERRTAVVQDILLGMNAHIAYDLPQSLDATIERDASPERLAERRADYERLNDVLADAVNHVQRRAAWAYDPLMMLADIALGDLDEGLTSRVIEVWRTRVWERFLLLRRAADPDARRMVEQYVEGTAVGAAELLVEPQRLVPGLLGPVRAWRRSVGWIRRGALLARVRRRPRT
jgi:hypothetical protein